MRGGGNGDCTRSIMRTVSTGCEPPVCCVLAVTYVRGSFCWLLAPGLQFLSGGGGGGADILVPGLHSFKTYTNHPKHLTESVWINSYKVFSDLELIFYFFIICTNAKHWQMNRWAWNKSFSFFVCLVMCVFVVNVIIYFICLCFIYLCQTGSKGIHSPSRELCLVTIFRGIKMV